MGLLNRTSKPGDLRTVGVRLTPKGHALAEAIEVSWAKVEADLMRDFDEKDSRRLCKLLRHASKNLTEALGGDERQFDVPNDVLEEPSNRPIQSQ